jgi:hypothetical protein
MMFFYLIVFFLSGSDDPLHSEERACPDTHIVDTEGNDLDRIDPEDREDEEEIQDRAKQAAEVPQRGNQDYLE